MTDVYSWSQTDGSNTSTAPAGAPEGMAPSAVNDVLRAIMGSVAREQAHINFTATSGGAADVQTLSYSVAPSAYFTGQRFAFIAGYTNATTTPTLNVNSLGAKTIVQSDGSTALRANQITAGTAYEVEYDGTNFRLINVGVFQGPASSTNNGFVLFNGTGGQVVKDAGYSTIPVSAGGTGQTSLTANNVLLGNGTSAVQLIAPSTSGNVLASNGTTFTSRSPSGLPGTLTAGTACTKNPYANSTSTSQAHGLGAQPTFVIGYIECLTTEYGYSVGDRLYFTSHSSDMQAINSGIEIVTSSTNTTILIGPNTISIIQKSSPSGASVTITAANWKVVATPYLLN